MTNLSIRFLILALTAAALAGCATTRIDSGDTTEQQLAGYLAQARESAAQLDSGGVTAGRALAQYNRACTELALLLKTAENGKWWNRTAKAGAYQLVFAPAGKGVWAPDYFTELLSTSSINGDLVRNPVIRSGAGGTLVGVRKKDPREEFAPHVGVAGPVTATITFDGNTATLALRNPTDATSIRIGDNRFSLAADFSAPLCFYPNVNANLFGLVQALNPERFADLEGLYFLEPYDPKRIPVIYVHGLASSPYMWRNSINEMNADPELRKRYQAVVFGYPSGNPFAYSSMHFRRALATFEKKYPLPDGYVLVSHSMGGLLSRMQAQTLTRKDWRAELGPEADELFEAEPFGQLLQECVLFEADPNAKRIVFMCTPHRGAKMADALLGRIARSIIRVPSSITGALQDAPQEDLSVFSGESGQLPTSVSSLAPGNVIYRVINAREIKPPVHSIVGTGWWGHEPLEKSSDGVVAHWSSHLDYAQSEVPVPNRHTFVPDMRGTSAELQRILRLHLGTVR